VLPSSSHPLAAGIRTRTSPHAIAGRVGWTEAWVRIDSVDAAVLDLLALGAEVEVVHPPHLRAQVRETALRIAELHVGTGAPPLVPAGDGVSEHGRA
jgi:predicted DNA-binding transcriptional regulator YafY